MSTKKLMKLAASFTLFLYSYSALLPAWADAVTKSAQEGNQAAVKAMETFSAPKLDSKTGDILFGSGGQSSNIRVQDIFPGAVGPEDPSLKDAFGNEEKTIKSGSAANAALASEESMNGEAYRLLKGSVGMIRPNLKNDPLWTNTDTITANQDMFEKEFADCTEQSTVKETKLKKHVPDYKICENVNKPKGNCDINHYIEIEPEPTDLFFLVDNSSSMESAIDSLRVNASKVADLLGARNEGQLRIGGAITRGNKYLGNHVKLGSIDNFQDWINSVRIDGGGTETFDALRWASANNDWRENVNKVFVIIGNKDSGGSESPANIIASLGYKVYIFHDNADIVAIGEHVANNFTAGGLFKVAQFLTVVRDRWEPQECIQAAKSTRDGFCTGSYETVSGDTECVNISGFDVCPDDPIYKKLSTPPIPDVSKMALKVKVGDVSCPFNEGKMECYTDSNGNQQCPENSASTCSVSHSLNVKEIPLVAKVAVQDVPGSGETNRVVFDFIAGTYTNTSRATQIDGFIEEGSYDYVCKKGADGKLLPHKFALSSSAVWTGHKFAPNTLGTASVTVAQAPSCENGLKMIVDIKDTGGGNGTGFYAQELIFKKVTINAESWGPDHCVASAKKIANGQCSEGGTLKVTKGVSSGCLPLNGISVCPGDPMYAAMKASPIPGIDKLALTVKVDGCVNNSLRKSTCGDFVDQGCGFISSECVGGAKGASGYCYVQEEVWDCGEDVEVPSASLSTSYQCDGPVRCLGTECFNPTDEKSTDFAYAAATLQIAQFAANDLNCGDNPEGNLNCKVWVGEHMECKKAVGGWVDCCEAPDGVSLMDYVNLTMNTLNLATNVGAFGSMAQKQGLWSYGADMAAQGWSSVMSSMPWSSAADAATAGATEFVGPMAQTFIQGFQQSIMNAAAQWTAQLFGPAAANTIFAAGTLQGGASMTGSGSTATAAPYATTTTTGATTTTTTASSATFAPMLASVISVIMIAYIIYQIANILVNIIWECEDSEFELGAKKETKVCHFLGSYCASESAFGCVEKRESYCCFNSPLGRIIHEQARPQMGASMEWGLPEEPNCGGFALEDIAKIDWSKIDISEWIGLLDLSGHYPTINNVSLDQLTGSGNVLNVDGDRMDTLERNTDRLKDLPVPDVRKEAEDDLRSGLFQ